MNNAIIEQKKEVVAEIAKLIGDSAATVIVEYRGLTVKELETLRKELRKEQVELRVYKNTMVTRAIEANGLKLDKDLTGPNAFAFAKSDAVAGPKVIAKFSKSNPKLVIKSGIVDKKLVNDAEIKTLATLPNREGLISMFIGCLQAPVRNFALAVKAVSEKQ